MLVSYFSIWGKNRNYELQLTLIQIEMINNRALIQKKSPAKARLFIQISSDYFVFFSKALRIRCCVSYTIGVATKIEE